MTALVGFILGFFVGAVLMLVLIALRADWR